MVQFIINNHYVAIRHAPQSLIRELTRATSYLVAGYRFSPAFRAKRWDGRERLLKFSGSKGYRAPVGLLEDMVRIAREAGQDPDVIDERELFSKRIQYRWASELILRPYQQAAVKAVTDEPDGWSYGSGLLKMPIRSGKTKTAAGIIRALGRRTLFVVPSQMLLYQTQKSLEESLLCKVGVIGDSRWEERAITVATIQTLSKARGGIRKDKIGRKVRAPTDPRWPKVAYGYDLLIWDEVHHARGEAWHETMLNIASKHRIGLSATIELDNDRENERGVIWLKACCGNVRYEVATSDLIEQGYLMRQKIELWRCSEPTGHETEEWSQGLLNTLIYENEWRNRRVAEIALQKVCDGHKVLIVSNRLNQIRFLSSLINATALRKHFTTIVGSDPSDVRAQKIEEFKQGHIHLIIGTVFAEGVDIPEVSCVINAEGGRDVKTAIQRMRNMTPCEGKMEAVFVDFVDLTNRFFAKHSKERLQVYRSEPAFLVKIMG